MNNIELSGKVLNTPVKEETFGTESIYAFNLGVKKPNKEEYYIIPIRISDRFTVFHQVKEGAYVDLVGSIRTYNKHTKGKKYTLVVSVFVSRISILDEFAESVDEGVVRGSIMNKPYFVEATEKMPQRCDLVLRIERNNGKYATLPLTFRGRNAEFVSDLEKGTNLKCDGRLQSRMFKKEDKEITIVEFVVTGVAVEK